MSKQTKAQTVQEPVDATIPADQSVSPTETGVEGQQQWKADQQPVVGVNFDLGGEPVIASSVSPTVTGVESQQTGTQPQHLQSVPVSPQPLQVGQTIPQPALLPSQVREQQTPPQQQDFSAALKARTEQIEAKLKADYEAKLADYEALKLKVTEFETQITTQEKDKESLQATLSEAQQKTATAESEAVEASYRAAVVAEASKLGFADPTDAVGLMDRAKTTQGEDGSWKGLTETLTDMLKSKPYLLARGRMAPVIESVNPSRDSAAPSRTDATRKGEYFQGGGSSFWQGGGVRMPVSIKE